MKLYTQKWIKYNAKKKLHNMPYYNDRKKIDIVFNEIMQTWTIF